MEGGDGEENNANICDDSSTIAGFLSPRRVGVTRRLSLSRLGSGW